MRRTTHQKNRKLTQWQANKLKIVIEEMLTCPEYLEIVRLFEKRLKEKLMME